jgi:hypothetical protein
MEPTLRLYVRSINAEFPRKSIGASVTNLNLASGDPRSTMRDYWDNWADSPGWGRGSGPPSSDQVGDNLGPGKSIGASVTNLNLASGDPRLTMGDDWKNWGRRHGWGRESGLATSRQVGGDLVNDRLNVLLHRLTVRKEGDDAYLIYDPYTRAVFAANEEFVTILTSTTSGSQDSGKIQKLVNLVRQFYDV